MIILKVFFSFSRKTRDIFANDFLKVDRTWLAHFTVLLSVGHLKGSMRKTPKIPKNVSFLNIHQYKTRDYEPLSKKEWLRQFSHFSD